MQLVGAEGEHEDDAGSRQAASEEGDHVERRAIGPVEVVDDGDDVGIRGDPGEQVAQPPELRRATRCGVAEPGRPRRPPNRSWMLAASAPTLATVVREPAEPLEDREVGKRLADLEAAALEDPNRSLAGRICGRRTASSAISRLLPIPASPLTSTTTRSLVRAAAVARAEPRRGRRRAR